jgi:hypothetical protein
MAVDAEALKPCPFCGAEARWVEDTGEFDKPFGLIVEHAETCFLGSRMMAEWEHILAAWNTRAASEPPAPVGSVDGERLRAKRGHIATRSVVLAEIPRLTVLSDARAVPLADAITRALATPSSDPIAGERDTRGNDQACHPDWLYVEACRESLDDPDWKPNRAIWADLCDTARNAIRALTGSEPSAAAIAATGKGEGA